MNGGLTLIEMDERRNANENIRKALEFIEERVKRPCMGIDGRVASLTEIMLVIHGLLTAGTPFDSTPALKEWRRERGLPTGEQSPAPSRTPEETVLLAGRMYERGDGDRLHAWLVCMLDGLWMGWERLPMSCMPLSADEIAE